MTYDCSSRSEYERGTPGFAVVQYPTRLLSPCGASGEGEIWAARMEVSRLCVHPEPKCQTPDPFSICVSSVSSVALAATLSRNCPQALPALDPATASSLETEH